MWFHGDVRERVNIKLVKTKQCIIEMEESYYPVANKQVATIDPKILIKAK